MPFYTGKTGKVRTNPSLTTPLKVTHWEGNLRWQLCESTNSESGGVEEFETGVLGGDVTIRGNVEIGTTPVSQVRPGNDVVFLGVFLGSTAGPSIKGFLAVSDFTIGNEVRGLAPFTITGKFSGGVTTSLL